MKSIYEYTSYRAYLEDFYSRKKAAEGYTYRDFAAATGMNSTSWLLHLIRGNKNLSEKSVSQVMAALGLSRVESDFFALLVDFTQAKTGEAKDQAYQEMLRFKRKHRMARIEKDQYEYYSKWYHPVVRSLVAKLDWGEDYSLLARSLVPAITAREAKHSVKLLQKLGFIELNDKGIWKLTKTIISTGDEVGSLQVINYHKQVSRLAEGAHDRAPREKRDISALTLGIGASEAARIKIRLQEFRKEILEIARSAENTDRVYQLNLQFFPVSQTEGTEE